VVREIPKGHGLDSRPANQADLSVGKLGAVQGLHGFLCSRLGRCGGWRSGER